ncbi:SAM pointed domain-containing Ets transcription factor-like isoform X1 [Nerophis lumbriciformis]|uniref:SAM pointed domain-containing Ets transcription factor-like isoform X1 n=2 Tax=Nerophis lumbriciformis TaxID=546530 RepID=UPI002ADF8B73|nr:SAM pointed domain-containing Ets transcription factor-like isoform X1 [Nerophis lumbriciformis]XP_061827765.1 SAM pointed domain-containing Ets transcription factor-like isoform X1 [Nerophis lumbriciformis]XP_061827775.1 SAM pointed domain-containing Ets transcription factor-like isoform X1 [Nerophis lumbriciformis]
MGTSGCDHMISTVRDTSLAWLEETEDIKPHRSLLLLPNFSLPGVYPSCHNRLSGDVPRMTEAHAPPAPTLGTPEASSSMLSPGQNTAPVVEDEAEEHCLEQVQSMVVGEVLSDVNEACKLLNIAPDPLDWSCMHVYKWLLWTEHLYKLPQISLLFNELNGRELCSLTEAEFRQRSSQYGDMLYAHLDIWRSAAAMKEQCPTEAEFANDNSWCNYHSQPIHLWQFLRDLLLKPHNYSRCIRWLNKEKGIFKIEDSAYVARLWGIRKNRPAMNYDKLSRSIRQYYKKGIIRKPEVSRRLVYQFVNPV